MIKRTSAKVYKSAFKDRLRYKQDKAGPGRLDNTVLRHFDYGFVTNSWKTLLRRPTTLFKWMLIVQKKEHSSVEMQESAKIFWLRAAMPATWMARKQGTLRDLISLRHHTYPDLLVVRGRGKEGMKRMYGVEYLTILMACTRTA